MEDGVTNNNLTKNNVKVVVPLKYLSNFWRIGTYNFVSVI